MSMRAGRSIVGRGVRPAQVFKKRHDIFNTNVPTGADAFLLGEIDLRETGTIYALKVSFGAFGQAIVTADLQSIHIVARCVPANTGLPDLTSPIELDTMNGFFVGSFLFGGNGTNAFIINFNEKFRFRRKCDENSLIQIIAQSTSIAGTGRTIEFRGVLSAVIRVK